MNVDNDGRCFAMISLELMSEENSIDVYSFEKENREYFERSLPQSSPYFYLIVLETLKQIHQLP